jgi:hypothetical protein
MLASARRGSSARPSVGPAPQPVTYLLGCGVWQEIFGLTPA